MSIEELVNDIQGGNVSGMDELYSLTRRLIFSVCNRYQGLAEMDDLKQEGYLALAAAVGDYDPAAGAKFTTYLSQCVRFRILNYLRANKSDTVSFETPISSEDGEDLTLEDVISSGEDIESDAVESVYNTGIKCELWNEVDALPGDESRVIRSCYRDNKSLKQTANETGVSYEKARSTRDKGLNTLQKSKRLKNILEDSEIFSAAIRGNGARRFQETETSSTERIAIELYERYRRAKDDNSGCYPEI